MTEEIKKLINHRDNMKARLRHMINDAAWYREEIKKVTGLIDRKVAEERRRDKKLYDEEARRQNE